jgi:hypothetical protein
VEAYQLVLAEAAAMMLATASRAEQRKLATILDRLKGTPFRRGDFQERDADGRINEVSVEDEWLITFWSDHRVHELRIVRLERVED